MPLHNHRTGRMQIKPPADVDSFGTNYDLHFPNWTRGPSTLAKVIRIPAHLVVETKCKSGLVASTIKPVWRIRIGTGLKRIHFARLFRYVRSRSMIKTAMVSCDPSTTHSVESVHHSSGLDEERDGSRGTVTCVIPVAQELFH